MKNDRGIALLEVLISVVILSSSIILIMRPMISSLSVFEYVAARLELNRLISNQIWEWERRALELKQPVQLTQPVLYGNSSAYHVTAAAMPQDKKNLEDVKLHVAWVSGGRSRSFSREVYVFSAYE